MQATYLVISLDGRARRHRRRRRQKKHHLASSSGDVTMVVRHAHVAAYLQTYYTIADAVVRVDLPVWYVELTRQETSADINPILGLALHKWNMTGPT